jgi:phosphoglycerate kinase
VSKRTLADLDLGGRRVFVRVDFNVPIAGGAIGDDTRVRASLPTIRHALDAGAAAVVLASHLGRPKGKPAETYSLRPVAERTAALLGRPVGFAGDCVGPAAEAAVGDAGRGGVVLLENLRFHPGEEQNDASFAARLAALADVYVNDAFGAAHRAHASVHAIVPLLPQAGAGLLMEKELRYLGRALDNPERPFAAILGGVKVSDKIEVIENLLPRVDRLLLGGAMAYTFFRALGKPVGASLVEHDKLDAARAVMARARERGLRLLLPVDHVVAAAMAPDAAAETISVDDARIDGRIGLDIGPETAKAYAGALADARTVVWNGPMGVFELAPFAHGTMAVARAVAAVEGTTIVGGGDSIAAVAAAGVADRITHISTGGGASLEFLGGRTLPGVAALPDR